MRAISNFRKYMSNTVQVEPRISLDAYAKPTYGPAVSYQAHIAKGARLIPSMGGAEVVDAIQIYINGSPAVLPTARVTLSTADVGSTESFDRQPRLLAVERRFAPEGPSFSVLYCGWAPRSV